MKHARLWLAYVFLLTAAWGQSEAQEIPPATHRQSLTVPTSVAAQSPSPSRVGTRNAPLAVTTVERSEDVTERVAAARHRTWEQANGKYVLLLAIAMAVIALGQLFLFVWQLSLMRRSVDDAGAAAEAAVSAARAAELNARAAIGMELPLVRAKPEDLLSTNQLLDHDGAYAGSIEDGPPTRYSAVGGMEFSNDGRTPAYLLSLSVGWMVARELPATPAYRRSDRMGHAAMIRPGESFHADLHYGIELSKDERRATQQDEQWLWFYGALEYNDFLGDRRVTRFCWRYANRNAEGTKHYFFASDGHPPEEYTRRT